MKPKTLRRIAWASFAVAVFDYALSWYPGIGSASIIFLCSALVLFSAAIGNFLNAHYTELEEKEAEERRRRFRVGSLRP